MRNWWPSIPNWTSEFAASLVVQLTYADSVMRGFGSIDRFETVSAPSGVPVVDALVAPPAPVVAPATPVEPTVPTVLPALVVVPPPVVWVPLPATAEVTPEVEVPFVVPIAASLAVA